MKKTVSLLMTLVLALTLCVSASAEMLTGGWAGAALEDAVPVPEEARAAFDKAMEKDPLMGAEYTPVALLATQIVAGTNYCILCQVTPVVPDPVPTWALVYIYADLEGNAERLNVYELYIDKHVYPPETQE